MWCFIPKITSLPGRRAGNIFILYSTAFGYDVPEPIVRPIKEREARAVLKAKPTGK
jgi:hypothetical protein